MKLGTIFYMLSNKVFTRKNLIILTAILIAVSLVFIFWVLLLDDGILALKEGNYKSAMKHLKPLAVLGDSKSQYLIGNMYAFGWGVEKNDFEANKWFVRAGYAQHGEIDRAAPAQYFVAERFETGKGLASANIHEAMKWYKMSAKGGYAPAKIKLQLLNKHQ